MMLAEGFGAGVDLSNCKMVSYKYKGANHQFTLYYDWNASVDYFGVGVWDYPFVEMPYAPEWETVHIDLGWMTSNGWQKNIPTYPVLEAATAFRFVVTNDFFDTSLWIEDLKCEEEVSGYSPVEIDTTTALPKIASKASPLNVSVQGKNIAVSGIENGSLYMLSNMLGQVMASGRTNGSSLNLNVASSGKYILRIGSKQTAISIR